MGNFAALSQRLRFWPIHRSGLATVAAILFCVAMIPVTSWGQNPTAKASKADEAKPDQESASFPHKIACGKIENFYEVASGLYSGGSPETEEDFAALAKRGVTHIVSVDGKPPLVQLAKKYNLKYIHLPIGYGQLTDKTMAQIAASMPKSPDSQVFIHCHHGKHRGPAAAAIACQFTKGLSPDQAVAWLKVAGTSPDYPGLYEAVRNFSKVSKQEIEKQREGLVETVAPPPLVEAMLIIDEQFDAITAAATSSTANAAPPAGTLATATLLKEQLQELARDKHSSKPDAFARHLKEAIEATISLENSLRTGASQDIPKALAATKATCARCHQATRDRP